MSLFAAWTGAVLGAARMELPVMPAPSVPEPRRFRLAYNPVPAALPGFGRPLMAEQAQASVRDRLWLEK
ncbi:hypothetical protein [Azospirillum sp. Sh1]|uniref:hypothetical protein n=1 Tax=Azospirillum sp. Sh1 TaxID=2607285 RepID=UPI0011EFBD0E|nr:hypothetical protein [Azospirillum sp. Sh1]KAA0570494.1 hypothetical protein FZ029_30230 [Azospirillum sp. Sh1]